ncbi:MAG: hypothetical protein H7A45_15120 [Verrucomicrobiales bacterium]|nr:hypothetical protein [Verrucomicrobiales bacterium]MCP5526103.1 hypothetical protein [Verrucomicrobiales bacterium]
MKTHPDAEFLSANLGFVEEAVATVPAMVPPRWKAVLRSLVVGAGFLLLAQFSAARADAAGGCSHEPFGDWSIVWVGANGSVEMADASFQPAGPSGWNLVGRFEWRNLGNSEVYRQPVSGDFAPETCRLTVQGIGDEATYYAMLSQDGRLLCGTYSTDARHRWWGARSTVNENDFDRNDWQRGWQPAAAASLTKSPNADGDPGSYGVVGASASAADGEPALVAPFQFGGDWTWSGTCPTMLSFALKWLEETPATAAPSVWISGPGGSASADCTDTGLPRREGWQTYLVEVDPSRWSLDEGTDWHELLRNVERLEIRPSLQPGSSERVGIDNIRLLRPQQRQEYMEWKASADGMGRLLGRGEIRAADEETPGLLEWQQTGEGIPHPPDGRPAFFARVPAFQNRANGLSLYLDHLGPNGRQRYLSQYTIIWDLLVPGPLDWLPFFNTEPTNVASGGGDADLYLGPEGQLTAAGIGSSQSGVIAANKWHRIAFALDAAAGHVLWTVDGATVLTAVYTPAALGKWTLFTGCDPGADLLFFNEPSGGKYTHEVLWMGLAMIDRTLSASELEALGGVTSEGIIQPILPVLRLPGLGVAPDAVPTVEVVVDGRVGQAYRLEHTGNLVNWGKVAETVRFQTATHTFVVPASGTAEFFRVVNVLDLDP